MSSSIRPSAWDAAQARLQAAHQDLAKADPHKSAAILATIILQLHLSSLDAQRSALAILRQELPTVRPLGARFRLGLAVMEHRSDLDDTLQGNALALSASLHAENTMSFYGIRYGVSPRVALERN